MNDVGRSIETKESGEAELRTRVLVVDDHAIVRTGIALLLQTSPAIHVCGQAGSIAEARTAVAQLKPGLVLLDLLLNRVTSLDLIKELHSDYPKMPILVLSMMDEFTYAKRCLKAGALGFIAKERGASELLEAIDHVLSGKRYVSDEITQRLLMEQSTRGTNETPSLMEAVDASLSNRELEVFQLIGQALVTREIAKLLGISPKTVEAHKGHIKNKLNYNTAGELAVGAVQWCRSNALGAGSE